MSGIVGMGTPQDIKSPIPGADELIAEAAGNSKGASLPTPLAPPSDEPDLAAYYAKVSGSAPAQASGEPDLAAYYAKAVQPSEPAAEPARGMLSANLTPSGIAQQVRDFPARAKASFGVTDSEKLASLQQSFGNDNVRKVSDGFMIKDNGKWRRFDKSSGLLDIIANNARPIEEGAVSAGLTGVGAAETATGGGALAGVPTMAAAGAAGHLAGDATQAALGIPRDSSRNAGAEYATSAVLNAAAMKLLPIAGNAIARKLAGVSATDMAAADAASSTMSAFGAKATTTSADQLVAQDAKDRLVAVDNLRQNFGIDMPLTRQSTIGDNVSREATQAVAGTREYQQGMRAIGQQLVDGYNKIIGFVGDISGAKKTGVANEAVSTVANLDTVEGKMLGDFRGLASKAGGDTALPTQNFTQNLSQQLSELGFRKEGDKLIAPSVEDLQLKGVVLTRQAKLLLTKLNGLQETAVNGEGKMTYDEMLSQYKTLTSMINAVNPQKAEQQKFFSTLVNLKNGLRDDINGWTGNLLQKFDPSAGEEYASSLTRFSNIKQAHDTLGSMLDKDATSAEALASQLFSSRNLDKLKAFKSLLQNESPGTWQKVVGGYFDNLRTLATDKGTGIVDWRQVYNKHLALGNDVTEAIFGEGGPQLLNDFLGNAARLSKEQVDTMNVPSAQGAVKKLLVSSVKLFHGDIPGAARLIATIGDKGAVADYFSRTSIDKLVAGLDPAQRPAYRKLISATIDQISKTAAPYATPMKATIPAAIGANRLQRQR
jgi:hypothetical protein